MGQDPSQIRQDIEQTRERMGDTVEALGHKTDVTGRAKEAISDKVGTVRSKVVGRDSRQRGGEAGRPPAPRASPRRTRSGSGSRAVAVGFIAGLLVPATKVEDEKIGPIADQVKEKAKETGQEALERGKEVAEPGGRDREGSRPREGRGAKDSAQARPGGQRLTVRRRETMACRLRPSDEKRIGPPAGGAGAPAQGRHRADRQAHGRGVQGGQPHRLGGRADLLRGAVDLPGADRAGVDRRPGR